MKKTTQWCLLAIATGTMALTGCKKETLTDQPINAADNLAAQKVQQWLKAQPQPLAKRGRKAGTTLPMLYLDWPTASFNTATGTYRVNTTLGNGTAQAYLVATQNKAGQITGGQYLLVLPDRKKMGDAAAKAYNPAALLANAVPRNFSGALLHYSTDGLYTGSQVYSEGQLLPNATANLATRDDADSDPDPNNVVLECGDAIGVTACIDWYWQTYVNGVLEFEDYFATTCCGGTSGGGNGGGVSAEQACANDLAAFVSQGQAEEGPTDVTYTPVGPNAWEAKYAWRIYRDAPNQYEILSFETGIMRRPNPNAGFEFESLRHDYIRHNGYIRSGGTRTYQDMGATTSINSANRLSANINLNFSVTSCVPCNNNIKRTEAFYKSKTFSVIGAVVYNNPE